MRAQSLFFITSISLILISCGQSEEVTSATTSFSKSQSAWKQFKSEVGTSYSYTDHGATWSGSSWSTTIQVEDDIVVGRSFESKDSDGNLDYQWTETANEIGDNEGGAAILTIDEIYQKCESEVLNASPEDYEILFNVHESGPEAGVIKTCVKIPIGCQDDCSRGYDVSDITVL